MILQFLGNGIVNGSLIALTALGFSLIYNTMRVFHIAYAGIYIWAGYTLYFFMEQMHWPVLPAIVMAMAMAAILSIACEIFLYHPLQKRGRSSDSLMISSVGMLILLVSTAELFFGNAAQYIDFSLPGEQVNGFMLLSSYRMLSLFISLLMIGIFFIYLKYSRTGIRIRALRDNETLSRILGIRVTRLKLLLYTLSGVFVALAAGMSTLDVGINPHLGISIFINAFVALVIGGIGRFDGPVIGGLLLGILQAMTEYFFDSRWVMMLTFSMLILFLFIKPRGLIPEKSRAF
ncbi:MAG: branched-chain amino acid ABC transporter permease [Bacteroidota bacterium]